MKFTLDRKSIESKVKAAAIEKAKSMLLDVTCPHCGAALRVKAGKFPCPKCGKPIDLIIK